MEVKLDIPPGGQRVVTEEEYEEEFQGAGQLPDLSWLVLSYVDARHVKVHGSAHSMPGK